MSDSTEIARRDTAQMVQSPLPAFSGQQMAEALVAYKDLQAALDKAMPDAIMELDGKPYRKKGYWRAVAVAFNLTVEPTDEKYLERGAFKDGRPNFGYVVAYRASTPNGRSATGDGACFAVEKAKRFRCPHPEDPDNPRSRRTLHFPPENCPDYNPEFQWLSLPGQSTDHNIRGHAHTRAYNRAVSNLVGFGEVSAEEVDRDEHVTTTHQQESVPAGERKERPAKEAKADTAAKTEPRSDGVTTVKAVKVVEGESARGPWTRYDVQFTDGRRGNTFDKKLGEQALAFKASGADIVPELEKKDKGTDLKGFSIPAQVQPQAAAISDEELAKPEEKVVETILVTRKIAGANGAKDWWVVQGSEREYVTDSEDVLQAADAFKVSKEKVYVQYDRKRGTRGVVRVATYFVQVSEQQAASVPLHQTELPA